MLTHLSKQINTAGALLTVGGIPLRNVYVMGLIVIPIPTVPIVNSTFFLKLVSNGEYVLDVPFCTYSYGFLSSYESVAECWLYEPVYGYSPIHNIAMPSGGALYFPDTVNVEFQVLQGVAPLVSVFYGNAV